MATNTYMSFLMVKEGSSYNKLIDIVDYPDITGEKELLQTTTLSDGQHTHILGISGNDAKTFNTNYDHAKFLELKEMEGQEKDFAVWFGGTEDEDGVATPTGSEGKFSFKGELSVRVTGGGVNQVRQMSIQIAAKSIVKFE